MTRRSEHGVAGDVLGQFECAWAMLDEALRRIPDAEWRADAAHGSAPARLAVHVLETAAYYMSADPAAFPVSGRLAVDWLAAAPGELPDRASAVDELALTRTACRAWLGGVDDATMLAPDPVYGSEGMSRLDVSLYLLRHTHHHLGELFAHLRRCGVPRPAWR